MWRAIICCTYLPLQQKVTMLSCLLQTLSLNKYVPMVVKHPRKGFLSKQHIIAITFYCLFLVASHKFITKRGILMIQHTVWMSTNEQLYICKYRKRELANLVSEHSTHSDNRTMQRLACYIQYIQASHAGVSKELSECSRCCICFTKPGTYVHSWNELCILQHTVMQMKDLLETSWGTRVARVNKVTIS